MQRRRLEEIDQLRNLADQIIQRAEKMQAWNNLEEATFWRDIAIMVNKRRYKLIQYEERRQRSLDALTQARNTVDADYREVA